MAETDYNEILLEAIDAIVVSRISEVNFDRTIVATIVDASKAKDGEYVLSDGSVQFTAHSSSDKYKENDRVNVLIPSNDFSSTEKTILGKTSANVNDVPVTYVSPLEKIVPMETNYAAGLKGGITANSETEIFQLTNAEWIEVNESTLGYDTLCVSARFKTLLNDYDIRQGHYGLLVQLQTTNGYKHALTLDSTKDMFGNPYGYSMYLTQEQTYHLNLQDNIIGIKIDLYQMKDFKYNDGINSELQALPVMPYSNILVDNINVSFGYNAEQIEDNTVKIGTADSLTYNNVKDASVTKKLTLTWYNKDENNKYLGFADGAFADLLAAQTTGSQKYYIKWEHSLNNGQWEEIQKTGQEQELTVNLNMAWGLNEYRAIVVFDGASYTSNIIQFKNATGIDNPQERLQMLLTLHNVVDSSYDSYPLYGSDGVVINPLYARQNRKVYFSYSSEIGGSLEPDVLKGATAYFYIPQNSTMLEVPGGETNWDDDQDSDHSKTGYIAYVRRFSKEQTEPTVEEKTFLYRIKANYNPLFTNNKVILRIVDKNGFIYETSKTFAFSSYGTSGTDYSIIISGADGENGWVGSNGFTPKAQLYDANYKEITDIDWTWSKYPTGTIINANQSLSSTNTLYQAIKAQTTVSWVGKNVQISGIYPIPYSANEDYMYQGPTAIIYNSNGVNPSYYNGDLGIFKKSDNSEVTCTWSIEYFTKSNDDVSGDKKPWLSWGELTVTTDGHTRFKPSSMHLGDTYYLVLVAKNESTILWRQPLIILQNQYASGLLNNWDGNLIVDNEGNYILSSMIGAGSKDNQNRFSGVLMGEVSKVADKSAETGLFGYHEGVQSFGFRTNGTAFIGSSSSGRIEFNGSECTIQSTNYGVANNSGSFWDLNDGTLIMYGSGSEDNRDYFKFNEKNNGKLELQLSDGANIKIGKENLNTVIKAAENNVLLEVNNNFGEKVNNLEINTDGITASSIIRSGTGFQFNLDNASFRVGPISGNPVLKVDSNGLTINGSGTFTGALNVGDGAFRINSNEGVNFKDKFIVDSKGNVTASGNITANSMSVAGLTTGVNKAELTFNGKIICTDLHATSRGTIAGWGISGSGLSYNNNTLYLGTTGISSQIGDYQSVSGIVFKAGSNFGVTSSGDLYCATARLGESLITRRSISFDIKETSSLTENMPRISLKYTAENIIHGRSEYLPVLLRIQNYGVGSGAEISITSNGMNFYHYNQRPNNFANENGSQEYSESFGLYMNWHLTGNDDVLVVGSDTFIGRNFIEFHAPSTHLYKTRVSQDRLYFMYSDVEKGRLECYPNYVELKGTFKVNGQDLIGSSDIKLKKDIQDLSDKYDILFNSLHPRLYRFKEGTSGRLHSGYIVQEVLSALQENNISTQDFAAVCAFGNPLDETTEWGMRYEEIIPLNTWQIQKLKNKVLELETQLKLLQGEKGENNL